MNSKMGVAHRLGRVLETVTRQSGRLSTTPDYGSWLLGRETESQLRRRVRIQVILTVFILFTNLMGIVVATALVAFAFPVPSVFLRCSGMADVRGGAGLHRLALGLGTLWVTWPHRAITVRWSIEERSPTRIDHRNTFVAPWRVARMVLVLWGIGTTLLTVLYGLHDTDFIPRFLFAVSFPGILVATGCYMFTEFALRPVAAQALEAGPAPNRLTDGIMGRTMLVWLLGSGVPVLGIAVTAIFALSLENLTETQFAVRRTDPRGGDPASSVPC